jgi:TIR domain
VLVSLESFTDAQIAELYKNATVMYNDLYITVADLPKSEWSAIRIKQLRDLRESIEKYEKEMARRRTAPAPPSAGVGVPSATAPSRGRAARLFLSYSHLDEVYKNKLEKHLALLARLGLVETWSDRQILPGQQWDDKIRKQLAEADIVLLLVSANFIASDYSYYREMMPALERMDSGPQVVIPIVLSPVDWSAAPFSKVQALPPNGQPVTTWTNQDEAWAQVAKGIRGVVEHLGFGV